MKHIKGKTRHQGFSLLEVVIGTAILSFGLLGLVALQTVSSYSSYEARQRTLAGWLASDMVERARINKDIWTLQTPQSWAINETSTRTLPGCANADGTMGTASSCSQTDLLNLDLYNWQQSLRGASVSGAAGSLQQATGCVTLGANNALTVIMSWQGREETRDGAMWAPLASGATSTLQRDCGNASNRRRQLTLATTL